jgi:hypothetical protein
VDVDSFIAATTSDTNDQKAIQIALKAKAVARLFSQKFILGDTATTYNLSSLGGGSSVANVEFSGLDVLASGAMDYDIATDGDTLDFNHMDVLLDKVKLGPDALVMSRRTIREFKAALRALSNVAPEFVRSGSQNLLAYTGVPILLNDWVVDNLTVGSATSVCSSIYAMRMNLGDGLHGVYAGDSAGFVVQEIGQLESKDSTRTRIKWYCALALKSTQSLAIARGFKPA